MHCISIHPFSAAYLGSGQQSKHRSPDFIHLFRATSFSSSGGTPGVAPKPAKTYNLSSGESLHISQAGEITLCENPIFITSFLKTRMGFLASETIQLPISLPKLRLRSLTQHRLRLRAVTPSCLSLKGK